MHNRFWLLRKLTVFEGSHAAHDGLPPFVLVCREQIKASDILTELSMQRRLVHLRPRQDEDIDS